MPFDALLSMCLYVHFVITFYARTVIPIMVPLAPQHHRLAYQSWYSMVLLFCHKKEQALNLCFFMTDLVQDGMCFLECKGITELSSKGIEITATHVMPYAECVFMLVLAYLSMLGLAFPYWYPQLSSTIFWYTNFGTEWYYHFAIKGNNQ